MMASLLWRLLATIYHSLIYASNIHGVYKIHLIKRMGVSMSKSEDGPSYFVECIDYEENF